MAKEIRVNPEDLVLIAKELDRIAVALEGRKISSVDLSCSPIVERAYVEFLDDWDRTRKARIKNIQALEKYLQLIATSFREVDNKLANEVSGSDA
jgi:hypothetical protein